jgi:hypothetical protein
MEHKPVTELHSIATVIPFEPRPTLTRQQRLERWIELLEQEPDRRLRSLVEIEYRSTSDRREYRAENSPLTVAFEDPLLRAEGLKSDRIGECVEFFGLTNRQMHNAFCSCHVGTRLTARGAAARLRRLLPGDSVFMRGITRIVSRLGTLFAGR